jgi:hypothetical protein
MSVTQRREHNDFGAGFFKARQVVHVVEVKGLIKGDPDGAFGPRNSGSRRGLHR